MKKIKENNIGFQLYDIDNYKYSVNNICIYEYINA